MKRLPDTELEVMKAVWDSPQARATRSELEERLSSLGWATNTFNTYLARLTEKGFLSCAKQGKANCYTPLVGREEYLKFESKSVLNKVFGRSLKTFVASLAGSDALGDAEIDELRDYLDKLKGDGGK